MPQNIGKAISSILGQPFLDILKKMYVDDKLSSQEISEKIFQLTQIKITTRSIQRELRKNNLKHTIYL